MPLLPSLAPRLADLVINNVSSGRGFQLLR